MACRTPLMLLERLALLGPRPPMDVRTAWAAGASLPPKLSATSCETETHTYCERALQ